MSAYTPTAQQAFANAQALAATPGSRVLTAWMAERQAEREVGRNGGQPSIANASSGTSMADMFAAMPSAAGTHVTQATAMRVATVFACVRIIAGSIASMPVHVYSNSTGARSQVSDATLNRLFNQQPCAAYTAASYWQQVTSLSLLRGDAYSLIVRDKYGNASALVPLPWDATYVQRKPLAGVGHRLSYYVMVDGKAYGFDQDDILHMPGFGFDGEQGMSVIQHAAYNAAGTAIAMDRYAGQFFAGGAHPSIVLSSDKTISADQRSLLQDAFARRYSGVANAHKLPLVLTEGLKATPLSINAQDSQLLDSRRFGVQEICRAFGVPPHMVGETTASTSWGTGIEQMSRSFVTYTLNPILTLFEQEINRKLFAGTGQYAEFVREALLQGDLKAQSDYFRAALGGPGTGPAWMTVDEVRSKLNLSPRGADADQLFRPSTTAKTSEKATEKATE